jgi:hypothetical protein
MAMHSINPFGSDHNWPHLPQTPAASIKSLYRKRANTPCQCVQLAHSRFRYNTKTYQGLTSLHFISAPKRDGLDVLSMSLDGGYTRTA